MSLKSYTLVSFFSFTPLAKFFGFMCPSRMLSFLYQPRCTLYRLHYICICNMLLKFVKYVSFWTSGRQEKLLAKTLTQSYTAKHLITSTSRTNRLKGTESGQADVWFGLFLVSQPTKELIGDGIPSWFWIPSFATDWKCILTFNSRPTSSYQRTAVCDGTRSWQFAKC